MTGADTGSRPVRDVAERERVTLRRAAVAGFATWALVGGGLAVGLAGAGGQASAAGVVLGAVIAGIVASAWLLAALAIDVATRRPVGRRRLLWTIAVTLLTMVSPVFVLGAGG